MKHVSAVFIATCFALLVLASRAGDRAVDSGEIPGAQRQAARIAAVSGARRKGCAVTACGASGRDYRLCNSRAARTGPYVTSMTMHVPGGVVTPAMLPAVVPDVPQGQTEVLPLPYTFVIDAGSVVRASAEGYTE